MEKDIGNQNDKSAKLTSIENDIGDLPSDHSIRILIKEYDPNIGDQIRRAYALNGPCQPTKQSFPFRKFGALSRRFNPDWFKEYGNWFEYCIEKDAAFCLYCYLFKQIFGEQSGDDSFVGHRYSNWKKTGNFQKHVGGSNSAHNQVLEQV